MAIFSPIQWPYLNTSQAFQETCIFLGRSKTSHLYTSLPNPQHKPIKLLLPQSNVPSIASSLFYPICNDVPISNYYLLLKQYQFMTDKVQTGKPVQYSRKKIEAYSYGLADEIGKGYSSRVYRGRHDDTDESVAVKVIDLKMLKNDINRELLYSQIEILKELRDCRHVLSLCDIFSTRNNTYIITELCGSDLSKVIKQGLSHPQAFLYMQHIIQGYLQFHAKHIVHRDLKPANILLTHDNHIKIADFGFAIKIQALSKSSKYNVGSPLYMAPESLRKNEYSYKSDIWALGVIFYEMLFADTPWRAKNEKDLLRKIENEPIDDILANKNINANAKEFLTRCLRVDKHARMGPEQLPALALTLTPTTNTNVLTEKTLNVSHRITNESIILGSPLNDNKSLKIERSAEVHSYKRKDENIENATTHHHHQQYKVQQHTHTHNDAHIKLKTQQAEVIRAQPLGKDQEKLISKMLISEVHFCRFLFKLLQKIKQCSKIGLLKGVHREQVDRIHSSYTSIIKSKIQNLLSFKEHNFLKCQGYREYRWTSDCDKLIKIAKEYSDRYKTDLHSYWEESSTNALSISLQPTNRLIVIMYELLESEVAGMSNPEQDIPQLSKEVVVLDYLVTAQQLLEMISSNPQAYQRFARKSRIEEIVQGRTVDIHYELFGQIMQRVKHIMQRPQFVSFGLELAA